MVKWNKKTLNFSTLNSPLQQNFITVSLHSIHGKTYKKVPLREFKRHTALRVALCCSVSWEGEWHPSQVPDGGRVVLLPSSPDGGGAVLPHTGLAQIPPLKSAGWGYPHQLDRDTPSWLDGDNSPPIWDLAGVSPLPKTWPEYPHPPSVN